MLKIKVNFPDDMTEVYNRIADFQAEKIKKECTPAQIKAIISYLENQDKE